MKYVGQNLIYTKEMTENNINGILEVVFIVEKDGRITNVKTKKDLGYGSAKVAEDVVKNGKKWHPGIQNGKPVRTAVTLPIKLETVHFPEPKKSNKQAAIKRQTTKSSEDVVRFPPSKVTKDEVPQKKPVKSSPDEVRFPEPKKPAENTVIFSAVEVKPAPPRGMRDFMNYVGENYNFPKEALENNINGVVEVSFIVEKDGSLSNFDIKRDLKYGTGQEAVNVLKNYPEKWKPAIQNGQHVRVAYTMPIRLNTAAQ